MKTLSISTKYNSKNLDGYTVIPCLARPYVNSVYGSVNRFRDAINGANLVAPAPGSISKLLSGEKSVKPSETCILFLKQEHDSANKKPTFNEEKMVTIAEVVVKTKVETLRQKSGMTRLDLSKKLGVEEQFIEWVELHKPVSDVFARSLADFFKLEYKLN